MYLSASTTTHAILKMIHDPVGFGSGTETRTLSELIEVHYVSLMIYQQAVADLI